jgi:hypothetical protein
MNLADSRRAKVTCVLVDGQNRGLDSENARVSGTPANEGSSEIID